jgi:hypothetical protein
MIESCAVFFGAAWLLCVIRCTQRQFWALLLLSIPLCVVRAITKATTWPAFVVGYVLFMCWTMWRSGGFPSARSSWRGGHCPRPRADARMDMACRSRQAAQSARWLSGLSQPPRMEPRNLVPFFSPTLWGSILNPRLWLAAAAARDSLRSHGQCLHDSCDRLLGSILIPIALSPNLRMVHHYCQTANALFLIATVVLLIAEMIAVRKILYASVVGIALFGGAVIHIRDNEWPISTGAPRSEPRISRCAAGQGFDRARSSENQLLRGAQGFGPAGLGVFAEGRRDSRQP